MTFAEFDRRIRGELGHLGGELFKPSESENDAMFLWKTVIGGPDHYPAKLEWVVEQGEEAVYAKIKTFRRRCSARGTNVSEAVCRCVAALYGWKIDEVVAEKV